METHVTEMGAVRITLDAEYIEGLMAAEGLTLKEYEKKCDLDSSSSEDSEDQRISDAMYDGVTAMLPRLIESHRQKDGQVSDCMKLLIKDVQARITPENEEMAKMIIDNATKEMYHDFLSDVEEGPSILLADHLHRAGMTDLRNLHTRGGRYDA